MITIALFMRYYSSYRKLQYAKKKQQHGEQFWRIVHNHEISNWRQQARDYTQQARLWQENDEINRTIQNNASQKSLIRLKLWNTRQPRRIHQRLRTLPLWTPDKKELHYCTVVSPQKIVECGIWNMISDHQNSIKSSKINNSKETLIWTLRTSTTTSRYVSMQLLDSNKILFLVTSSPTDTTSFQNNSSQIVITLPILGMFRYTLPLKTHC